MLCYRCGSHVVDNREECPNCGQKLAGGGLRQTTGTFSRRRVGQNVIEGAPYKPQDLIAGRYLVKDTIGAGPLGFVYRALDQTAEVEVAVKVINSKLVQSPEERKNFSKLIGDARKLAHANVARTYDDGVDGENLYFTSQFLDGLSLRKIIDLRLGKGHFFSLREMEPIFAQLASALDAMHKVGPHSDLKPDNVLVLPDLVKVTDFGLGFAIPRLPFIQAQRTRKTDVYLGPEWAEGTAIDGRSDIYSLAVIMGEMLSGLLPDGAIPELQRRNPEVPAAIEGLYRRCLNGNLSARPMTAGDFFREFSAVSKEQQAPSGPVRESASGTGAASRPRPSVQVSASQMQARRETKNLPAVGNSSEPPTIPDTSVDRQIVEHKRPGVPLAKPTIPVGKPGDDQRQSTELVRSDMISTLDPEKPEGHKTVDLRAPIDPPTPLPLFSHMQPSDSGKGWQWAVVVLGLALGALLATWVIPKIKKHSATVSIPIVDAGLENVVPAAMNDAGLSGTVAVAQPTDAGVSHEEKSTVAAVKVDHSKDEPKTAPSVCPEGMKSIPSGSYMSGTAADDALRSFDERPLKPVSMKSYCIDYFEYPNLKGRQPGVNVTWAEAAHLCALRGKRLCTEDEWEKSCKGPANLKWPYGNEFDATACVTESDTGDKKPMAMLGKSLRCRSAYGIYDLSGNVAEWTAEKVVKGGSFDKPDFAVRCASRKISQSGVKSSDVGFRCCSDGR